MIISFNPVSLDFGDVKVGTPYTLQGFIFNDTDDITLTSIVVGDAQYTQDLALGLLPGDTGTSFNITFTPGGVGTFPTTITFHSSAANDPVVMTLTGKGVGSGKLICVNPSSWDFGAQKVGVATAEKIFVLKNNGDTTLTITALNYTTPFSAGGTQPALAYVLAAGATVNVGVKFTPTGGGYVSATGLSIVSDAVGSPKAITMIGTGYAITSAFSLLNGTGPTLAAFQNTVKQFNPLNLDCEESGQLVRMHNFEAPGVEKTLHGVYVFDENLGQATFTLTARQRGSGAFQVFASTVIGDGTADLSLRENFIPLVMDGEDIELTFSRNGASGPLSITEYQCKYLPFAQTLGTITNPGTLTPAYSLSGILSTLAGFQNIVKKFDPTSLSCEEICSTDKLVNFDLLTQEKSLYSLQVDYEDLGPATLTIIATDRRGETSSQSLSIGTAGATGEVLREIADLQITEEVIHIQLSVAQNGGPISILGMSPKFEPAGEVRKDS